MGGRIESVLDTSVSVPQTTTSNVPSAESFNQNVNEMSVKIDQIEQKLNEVEQFFSNSSTKLPNTPKGGSSVKDKEREKFLSSLKRMQQDAASWEAAATWRIQDRMDQFRMIMRQITQHKLAEPFMQPVDVVGLGLHDYYEVIEKPMDFSTIKSKMEARDGTGYKNVKEIHADVRLIFENAMTYNEEDVMFMLWRQLLPKVYVEEARWKKEEEEEFEMQLNKHLEQEAAHAKMARDLSLDLGEVDTHLKELREMVLRKCRKMTSKEKIRLGSAITRLSVEDITKALEMIARNDPTFQAAEDNVDIDIDAQSESTLWKLKFFVEDKLQAQMKRPTSTGGNKNGDINKRKRKIPEATGKCSKKKTKKS